MRTNNGFSSGSKYLLAFCMYVVESASQVLSVHCIALVFLSLFWIFSFCRHRINQENSSLIISCARDSDSIYSKLGWIWKNVFQNLIFVKPRRMDVSVRYVFSPLVSPLLFLQTALFLEKKILYLFRSSLTDIALRNNVWSWTLHCRYLSEYTLTSRKKWVLSPYNYLFYSPDYSLNILRWF